MIDDYYNRKAVQLGEFIFMIPDRYDEDKLKKDIAMGKFKKLYDRILKSLTPLEEKG